MSFYFIYNNLKVNPFILQDQPYPGFELLTWDNESWTDGTLWDLGLDAGYTKIGLGSVYGQVWKCLSHSREKELEDMFIHDNLLKPTEIKVLIQDIPPIIITARTFQLNSILTDYKIISDGKWMIKRI